MPKVVKALKAIEVARIEKPGYHAVGTVKGLHLQVTPAGSRSWVLRATIGDKRREIGLGSYPAVTLAQAHAIARDMRERINSGTDPLAERKESQSKLKAAHTLVMTFRQAAAGYIKAHRDGWKNLKHADQWESTLTTYAFPVIGDLSVKDVTQAHILKILEPIWSTKTETATRVRGRMECVLDWATVRGHRTGDNPAVWRGRLDKLLPKPNKLKEERHHPAVKVEEAGAFARDLRQKKGMAAVVLQFAMLTAARSGEARGATWQEIDLKNKVWTIPAKRMKAKRQHRVPLSAQAIELLEAQPRMAGTDLVFPSPMGGELSDMAMSELMRGMAYKDKAGAVCVPHGLRSTFTDWTHERANLPEWIAKKAKAHAVADKTEGAYFRSDLFEKRRHAMQEWADFLDNVEEVTSAEVIQLRA